MNTLFANSFPRLVTSALLAVSACVFSLGAQANLLTAGDFEGLTSIDPFWAGSPDTWGAENAFVTGPNYGVTPSGAQMLQINHAGGGSVSQVHQMVEGPFVAGTLFDFSVELNGSLPGLQAALLIGGRDTIGGGDIEFALSSVFALDADVNTWETLNFSTSFSNDYNIVSAEIRFIHNAPLSSGPGFADNAVLTATPPQGVPAPGTVLLMGLGLAAAGLRRFR